MRNTKLAKANNETTNTQAKKPSFTAFFKRHSKQLACIAVYAVVLCVMASGIVSAEGAPAVQPQNTAESLWSTIADLIKTWVTRLGGVIMFVGGVMFGLGWKNDDAEQKSRGTSTMIAGAIVAAIAAMTSTFFA